jgi:hypothetical protein
MKFQGGFFLVFHAFGTIQVLLLLCPHLVGIMDHLPMNALLVALFAPPISSFQKVGISLQSSNGYYQF